MSVQTDVLKRLDLIENSQKEAKIQKEMLDDMLGNDEHLHILQEKLDVTKRDLSDHREMLLNEPAGRKIVEAIKDIQEDIKTNKELLSAELLEYYVETGNDIIEIDEETEYRINFKGNVKRKATDIDNED